MSAWPHWAWLNVKGIKLPNHQRRPVKMWQTSIRCTAGEGSAIAGFMLRTPSMRLNGFLCTGRSRNKHTCIFCTKHTNTREKGDVTEGAFVPQWCQPSDESHVDEVNFLLVNGNRFGLLSAADAFSNDLLTLSQGWRLFLHCYCKFSFVAAVRFTQENRRWKSLLSNAQYKDENNVIMYNHFIYNNVWFNTALKSSRDISQQLWLLAH